MWDTSGVYDIIWYCHFVSDTLVFSISLVIKASLSSCSCFQGLASTCKFQPDTSLSSVSNTSDTYNANSVILTLPKVLNCSQHFPSWKCFCCNRIIFPGSYNSWISSLRHCCIVDIELKARPFSSSLCVCCILSVCCSLCVWDLQIVIFMRHIFGCFLLSRHTRNSARS